MPGFKRSERIKSRTSFSNLFKEGKYFKDSNFSLRLLHNNLNISRLGITITRAVFPKATDRNRVKRLIREVFRKNKPDLNKGCDLLIKPRNTMLSGLKYNDMEQAVLALYRIAGVLKQE